MICRGIIEEVISPYQAKVRLPIIHRSTSSPEFTPNDSLPYASICTIPNAHANIRVGDIVIVGFENNDEGKPIILGYLYKETLGDTALSLNLSALQVSGSTKLGYDTEIGNIKADDINKLSGITDNIQQQLNLISDRLKTLEDLAGLNKDTSEEILI